MSYYKTSTNFIIHIVLENTYPNEHICYKYAKALSQVVDTVLSHALHPLYSVIIINYNEHSSWKNKQYH